MFSSDVHASTSQSRRTLFVQEVARGVPPCDVGSQAVQFRRAIQRHLKACAVFPPRLADSVGSACAYGGDLGALYPAMGVLFLQVCRDGCPYTLVFGVYDVFVWRLVDCLALHHCVLVRERLVMVAGLDTTHHGGSSEPRSAGGGTAGALRCCAAEEAGRSPSFGPPTKLT